LTSPESNPQPTTTNLPPGSKFATGLFPTRNDEALIFSDRNSFHKIPRSALNSKQLKATNATLLCTLPIAEKQRLNEATTDSHGRIWAATGSDTDNDNKDAQLFIVTPDHRAVEIKQLQGQIILANAMCINKEETFFYLGCSIGGWVDRWRLDMNAKDPQSLLSDRQRCINIEKPAVPDGMTCDDEGRLYLAVFGGGRIQVHSQDGLMLRSIETPTLCPTCCVFANNMLVITSKTVEDDTWDEAEASGMQDMFSRFPDRLGWLYSVAIDGVTGVRKHALM